MTRERTPSRNAARPSGPARPSGRPESHGSHSAQGPHGPRGGKAVPPARLAAMDAIRAALAGDDLQAALDARLGRAAPSPSGSGGSSGPMDPRDVGLATELAYGTLRHLGRIESVLARFLKDPAKLPDPVRLALAVAGYEILFLDRVPVYASVDWAVDAIKAHGDAFGKVANAVLRKLDAVRDEAGRESYHGGPGVTEVERLARFHSCPPWLVELWLDAYGEEGARTLLAAQSAPPPLGLRVNLRRPGADELFASLAARPDCLLAVPPALPGGTSPLGAGATLAFPAGSGPDLDLAGLLAEGRVSRQSAASQQILAALLPASAGAPVWDCCAGRGGKTTLLLEAGRGPVLASDASPARLRGLPVELARLGLDSVDGAGPAGCLAFRARADRQPPLARPVPTVLVDAPCSGLGVISRRPDLKWKRQADDLPGLARLQAAILARACTAVAPGGALVYLTCTMNPAENGEVVETFLAGHSNFRLERVRATPLDSPLAEFFWGAVLRHR